MARIKAVFCSVMSIKACASENSALQNSLEDGYIGPPYWIIDGAGMNITVFFNMTGYSAPNQSSTDLAPTVRYPENSTPGRNREATTTGHLEANTTDHFPEIFSILKLDLSTTVYDTLETTTRDLQISTADDTVVPTTDSTPEVSTSVRITGISTTIPDSFKINRIYSNRPQMDHSMSQL